MQDFSHRPSADSCVIHFDRQFSGLFRVLFPFRADCVIYAALLTSAALASRSVIPCLDLVLGFPAFRALFHVFIISLNLYFGHSRTPVYRKLTAGKYYFRDKKLYDKNGNVQFDGEYQLLTSDGTVTLKDGEKAVFDTVWAGLGYTIREAYDGNYSTASTGSQGTVPVLGEDAANPQKAQAVLVNTYDPNGEIGGLTIAKEVSGDLSSVEDVFTFKVTFADNGSYSYRLNGAGTINGAGSVQLNRKVFIFRELICK